MIQMIFSIKPIETHQSKAGALRGSRKCIKNAFADSHLAAKRVARQRCRAWIETTKNMALRARRSESPGSDAGRGLKRINGFHLVSPEGESPGSDAGRGLKP